MKALIIDFSRVLIFAKEAEVKSLNARHRELSEDPDYQIFDHFDLNFELLEYLHQLRAQVPTYILTDGRLHVVPEVARYLRDVFEGAYTVESLGASKKDPQTYRDLVRTIGFAAGEVVFVDDKAANVAAAAEAGLVALQYRSNAELIPALQRLAG